MKRHACFDATGTYRYSLTREWNPSGPRIGFVLLNPSTADAQKDDPTIRRCIGFAQSWGYGAMEVVNLFAYRVTQPQVLLQVTNPIGPENDHHLLQVAQRVQKIVLGWGNRGTLYDRDQTVIQYLEPSHALYCLGKTQTGSPRHPLYLKREVQPVPFRSEFLRSDGL